MKLLIVNADDFGMTGGVNRAVIDGHTRGIITSTTIMANMPAFDDAVRLAKGQPSLGVGLHFNITEGKPLAGPVPSMTDGRGEFLGQSAVLARRTMTGSLRIEEIAIELRAQIEKVLNAGLRLTHVDSHKHTHAIPQVCRAVIDTIKDYGICAVRLPREKWSFNSSAISLKMITQSIGAFGLAQLCRLSEARLRGAKVKTPDAFFGIAQTGFWTRDRICKMIEELPDGVSELMCHPGYHDDELRNIKTRLLGSREKELQLLTDPDIVASLPERGVRLINFSHL
jgi:hopanoid biosynthesis associated protein HpnK